VIKRMNVKKITSRKALKFLGLLISAMVIASVSAATYNMFMNATVGVEAAELSFVASTDFGDCGGALLDNNQKVEFSSMNGQPGVEAIYYPVNITNGAAAGHNLELVVDTWTGAGQDNLYNMTVTMFSAGGTQEGVSIVLRPTTRGTSVETSGSVSIGTSETWDVRWTVYWNGSATVGTDSFDVYLLLVVS
jgi:hypothetical protein